MICAGMTRLFFLSCIGCKCLVSIGYYYKKPYIFLIKYQVYKTQQTNQCLYTIVHFLTDLASEASFSPDVGKITSGYVFNLHISKMAAVLILKKINMAYIIR